MPPHVPAFCGRGTSAEDTDGVTLTPLCFLSRQPHIGRLGLPHGPSGEKVAVVTVDDCDTAVAVRFGGVVGNYTCAAQGTQSGSKKSLDLTGPLLLGGVPNLPEDFPVRSRQFVGCMRNLTIDGRSVDMAGFIANNGTRAGCAAQRNFCEGNLVPERGQLCEPVGHHCVPLPAALRREELRARDSAQAQAPCRPRRPEGPSRGHVAAPAPPLRRVQALGTAALSDAEVQKRYGNEQVSLFLNHDARNRGHPALETPAGPKPPGQEGTCPSPAQGRGHCLAVGLCVTVGGTGSTASPVPRADVMPYPQRFSGESVVSWSDLDVTISVPWYLGLMFRTRTADGVLMEATAGASSRLHLQGPPGSPGVSSGPKLASPALPGRRPLCGPRDGREWHHLLVELKSAKEGKDIQYLAVLTLDYGVDQMASPWGQDPGLTRVSILAPLLPSAGVLAGLSRHEERFAGEGEERRVYGTPDDCSALWESRLTSPLALRDTVQIGNRLPGLRLRSVVLGGVSEDKVTVRRGFRGCMQVRTAGAGTTLAPLLPRGWSRGDLLVSGVRMGETSTNIATLNMDDALKVRVKDGCDMGDACASSPCPQHSHCRDAWDGYTCVCDRGYFGRKCVDVCHLNPCEHMAACVRSPGTPRGYVCECGASRYGPYCENRIDLPCPKGWWGNPVCGPCHCAVDKGFDPDCNKTNGQCQCKGIMCTHVPAEVGEVCGCSEAWGPGLLHLRAAGTTGLESSAHGREPEPRPWGRLLFGTDHDPTRGFWRLQENHYQPPGQDACLPCDCFPHGSHSRACDADTGQCACRPGVIGRQCNRCDNPFAEVTPLGCEVIYSGCPRAFEAGIWWPQTKFGQPAAVPCPKGSVGTAVRHCSGEKGWRPPELFNCTAAAFVQLKAANEKLSRNETRMDGPGALRLAKALRNATRHSATLFGQDVRSASQLLARVLRHESGRQGFELAATRDADFHQDVVRAGSALLAPGTRAAWEQIQRGEEGVAQLLRSFEDYFSNVARNLRRTYLRPFVIVTANMILAVDVFDKFNFSGAWVPRFEDIREDFPPELASSVFFSADFFRPPERRDSGVQCRSAGRGSLTSGLRGRRGGPSVVRLPRRPRALGPASESEAPSRRRKRHPDQPGQFAVALVVVYRTLGQLLPERYDPDRRSLRLPGRPVINTPVVSAVVHSEGAPLPSPLPRPVRVQFALLETRERTKPVCVFWNHSVTPGGPGGWSAKGCELLARNRTHVTCQCSHTASFAVLMDVSRRERHALAPRPRGPEDKEAGPQPRPQALMSPPAPRGRPAPEDRHLRSRVLSLAALLVAFVLLALVRTLRSNLHSAHRNLVGALFLSQLVFVIGVTQTGNPFLCTLIAIALHYVYMSAFAWTFVESLHVYRMLTEVRNIDTGPMRFYYVVGWGLPAVVTGLAVGLDPQGYGNPDFCWLSLRDTLIWSFVGPIGTVIIVNTVIFVLSAKASCQRKHHYYERKGIVALLRSAFLLLLLVGATWLLGLLAVNSDALALHYLFAISSCLQGLCVLLLHCVLNREVREHLKGVLAGRKPHPDDSATTRATLLTRSLNCNTTYSEEPHVLRTALGESTASLDSTGRDEGGQKLSVCSGPARGGLGEPDPSFLPRNGKKPPGHDSDSDSELSLDEQSSSYASSHSSDSEDDRVGAADKWDPAQGPVHSTPKGDPAANHVPAGWPDGSLAGSDSEEPGEKPPLKVETKVSVELHLDQQTNHCLDRLPDGESGALPRPAGAPCTQQPPEQRKGILKNKATYPPPLAEKALRSRLREKLAECQPSPSSSRSSSLGSCDGVRGPDGTITVKTPRREPAREHLNGVAMNVCVGSAQAHGSDSE
ncbi:hypothetical protein QTO34_012916 [Cnephaeus nilssonii]|uniref:Cadherin EGF LAG seven-pass G-type receptor 1 n=1 Tax=Cnephaeus nilssonii TaxID=3371016 RepID=A0AA40HB23_CNENI|nr:hypothetical protein QTO34_012916 [Eptesicus nilssonii]